MTERTLGFPAALLDASQIDRAYFVRIDLGGTVGTKRYHDSALRSDLPLTIDGALQTWSKYDVVVGHLAQGRHDALTVSWIDFANIAQNPATGKRWFNEWAESPGLREKRVWVYRGWWDLAGVYKGSYLEYAGKIANYELLNRARLALSPLRIGSKRGPTWVPNPVCPWASRSGDEGYRGTMTCQFFDPEPPGESGCDGTIAACGRRNNLQHFGGDHMMRDPNDPVIWGDA